MGLGRAERRIGGQGLPIAGRLLPSKISARSPYIFRSLTCPPCSRPLQTVAVGPGVQADADAILVLDARELGPATAWPRTHAFPDAPKVIRGGRGGVGWGVLRAWREMWPCVPAVLLRRSAGRWLHECRDRPTAAHLPPHRCRPCAPPPSPTSCERCSGTGCRRPSERARCAGRPVARSGGVCLQGWAPAVPAMRYWCQALPRLNAADVL